MYLKYATPREIDLKFSIWDKNTEYGHAKFVGNLVEISHFLENNDTTNLEVSALDLLAMQSYDPVAADQWLNWYYNVALSVFKGCNFDKVFSKSQIQRSLKTYPLPKLAGTATVGLN